MGELKEAKYTQLTEAEATYALREGWKLIYGEYPSIESLSILWSQSALETGRWKYIWNYNFGNIKRHDSHDWCMYKCSEVINGKNIWFTPPDPQTHFCAYPDSISGAKEYIEFISKRPHYKEAWEQVLAGSAVKYCAALRKAGYFTADLISYTKTVVKLCDEFKSKSEQLLTYAPPVPVQVEQTVVSAPIEQPVETQPVTTVSSFFGSISKFFTK
jgi:hypothetical protein